MNLTVTLRKSEEPKCFLQNGVVLSVNGSALPALYSKWKDAVALLRGNALLKALEIKL